MNNDIMQRIVALECEIALLPSGSISKKNINGKVYYYHRVNRGEKIKETYISFDELEELKEQIEKRRELENELKKLKRSLSSSQKQPSSYFFNTNIRIGEELKKYVLPVKKYKKRECYSILHEYIYSNQQDKVFILYGLRRTGKTTLI